MAPPMATIALAMLALTASVECSKLTFNVAAARNRPVSKVTTLLKDMLKQLEKEAQEDEEIYDRLACWCETNDKDKTKAIADAEDKISQLTTKIEELTALSARLGREISNLKKELAKNEEALSQATAIRKKQLEEFDKEENSLLESISALKAAVTVLSKHNRGEASAFLQVPHGQMLGVASTLQHEMEKHASLVQGVLTRSERKAAMSFIQASSDYFDAAPTFKQSYAPQSGEIFGILRQMQETFEKNLATAQQEEQANQKAYEELKAAKENEIKAGKEQIDMKSEELSDTDEKLAQSKEDLEDTQRSLAADQQFLQMLKEKCSATDKEWEERSHTRQLEMEAVSKALAILSGDDAHDLFGRTFSFLQAETAAVSSRRAKASDLLKAAADRLHSPKLATLAYSVRLDAFTRVKKAIDDMIADLLKEKADEIKHKDFCTDELNTNVLQAEKKEREKQDLITKIEDLEATIKTLTEEINTLKSEIAEMQLQLKRAGENRETENKEFQMTVADQRETQRLLQAALGVLEEFYGEQEKTSFAQQEPAGPPPPPGFEEYKKNAASGGVMSEIQQILSDAKAMEAEALKSENDAEEAYEAFVNETNLSIKAKLKEIANKQELKAKAELDLAKAKEDKDAVMDELEELRNYNAELHKSCDFVLKNFEVRQTARDEEVEALRQAKAILSGANFEEFLQKM